MKRLQRRQGNTGFVQAGNENLLASGFFRSRATKVLVVHEFMDERSMGSCPEYGSQAAAHIFPLKDFVSTVVKTTGTSNTLRALSDATVLLMIPWRSKLLVQTAFGPDGRSAPRRNCPELRVPSHQSWTIAFDDLLSHTIPDSPFN